MFHMFPMESWLLYIFLYIDSTQGGWGRGWAIKVMKWPLSVLRFPHVVPSWLRLPFFLLFLKLASKRLSSFLCITAAQHAGKLMQAQARCFGAGSVIGFCSDSRRGSLARMMRFPFLASQYPVDLKVKMNNFSWTCWTWPRPKIVSHCHVCQGRF